MHIGNKFLTLLSCDYDLSSRTLRVEYAARASYGSVTRGGSDESYFNRVEIYFCNVYLWKREIEVDVDDEELLEALYEVADLEEGEMELPRPGVFTDGRRFSSSQFDGWTHYYRNWQRALAANHISACPRMTEDGTVELVVDGLSRLIGWDILR